MSNTVDLKTLSDWELVCLFCWYGGPLPVISEKIMDEINTCVWQIQDGYGEPGYIPVRGWDWSGIRDSTPEAKKRIACQVRRILHREKISTVMVMNCAHRLTPAHMIAPLKWEIVDYE